VNKDRWSFIEIVLCCALAGCSAASPMTTRGNGMSNGPAAGSGNGSGGSGDLANANGGPLGTVGNGTGGVGTMVAPPPPVDPSAPTFKRDDTAMSGLDASTLTALKTATAKCAVTVTYPYENTVFPGGLMPPVIMFDGAADAAYLHFSYFMSDKVDYEFAAKVTAPNSIQISRDVWNEITRRTNNYALQVTLNVSSGGQASTCPMSWKIAPGNMIGAIYYNTYQAPSPGVPGEGAVMRQSLGANAEIYKQYTDALNAIPNTGPCYSCHSVSFNGTTMVASYHDYSGQVFRVEKFDIGQDVQPTASGKLDNANFGALTPDGKKILAMGNPECTAGSDTFPRKPNNFPLVEGAAVARLLDTATGMDLNAAGLNKDFYMWMPQFSPDGKKIVFNHAKPDGNGGTDRRELAVMDFDATTNTFSNLKVIISASKMMGISAPSLAYSPAPSLGGVLACGADMCGADGMAGSCMSMDTSGDMGGNIPGLNGAIPGIPGDVGALPMGSCDGPCYPAWPFFTPDDKAVIFAMTSEPDFTQAFPGRDAPSKSELWYVDLESGQYVRLDNLNKGLKDIDAVNNYYPTVMPVAVGGSFWVFWTAVRDYGNKLAGRDPNAGVSVAAADAIKKRIWGAAIKPKMPNVEFMDTTLVDPSSPGFYLDGQSESGNVRAFAALNPCLQNGATCMSGLDCCCGYCTAAPGAATGTCTCDVPMCAKINEKCTKDSDCCQPEKRGDPPLQCLGGFCNFIQLN
jgi:hypothetical protein